MTNKQKNKQNKPNQTKPNQTKTNWLTNIQSDNQIVMNDILCMTYQSMRMSSISSLEKSLPWYSILISPFFLSFFLLTSPRAWSFCSWWWVIHTDRVQWVSRQRFLQWGYRGHPYRLVIHIADIIYNNLYVTLNFSYLIYCFVCFVLFVLFCLLVCLLVIKLVN